MRFNLRAYRALRITNLVLPSRTITQLLKPLTYAVFTHKLKKTLKQRGIDSNLYSDHSFWRGGAAFALSCGVHGLCIKLQGDWLSNTYECYLDCSLLYKMKAVNMMSKTITHLHPRPLFGGNHNGL